MPTAPPRATGCGSHTARQTSASRTCRSEWPRSLKLHHSAFDADILGVRPDLTIEVRHDVLREADGPMLKHGLQEFDGQTISVPRQKVLRPNTDFLAERYERFRKVG